MRTRHLNGLLIVAILLISTVPLYAQRGQQNVAKLKADARNVVGTIANDKAKTQTYCQILDLARRVGRQLADIRRDPRQYSRHARDGRARLPILRVAPKETGVVRAAGCHQRAVL